mmetsp:Transcript_76294/g.221458  ORF Transcript_76294/g.221458 Transcript_76294/m.221458 type:complete len:204 (-) Transcript_76294:609-1220(-)
MLVERLQLRLECHARFGAKDAAHHLLQRTREGHATIAGGRQQARRIGVDDLLLQCLQLPVVLALQLGEIAEHGADGLGEHALDLVLHKAAEVLEADAGEPLGVEPLAGHLPEVLGVDLLQKVPERLRWALAVCPMRQREREADQALRQVAMAIDPWADVLGRQVLVVLVELVPDKNRALELRVELTRPLQRGHRGGVAGLLHN